MSHPLANKVAPKEDHKLVASALEGNQEALSTLIKRHQSFIYNVAWKISDQACHHGWNREAGL